LFSFDPIPVGLRYAERFRKPAVNLEKQETKSVIAPRSSGKENHLKNVKPFIETLRVTNPVRQSRASSRKRVLRGGG
jgi:hypothetical protein